MKNLVQFRKGFINIPGSNENNYELAISVNAELMQFGYILTENAISMLSCASKNDIVTFLNEIKTFLIDITGSSRTYKPFWKGFPEEVMSKSESELWIYQIMHYMSNGTFEPNEFTKTRTTAFEQVKYTKIKAGVESDFRKIFTDLVSGNQSLTPEDLKIVKWFISSNQELKYGNIPFKETLCTVVSELYQANRNISDFPKLTVTDVLRVAVGMSGGDVSLPAVPDKTIRANEWSRARVVNTAREAFKFKKFSNSDRRFILELLENTNCDVKEGVLKVNRWIRLGEILHPSKYEKRYPKAFNFFNILRNEKVSSWYGDVNVAFDKSLNDGLNKLSERSGEFMRRLDYLYRTNSNNAAEISKILFDASTKASNKVLYETYTHFEKRLKPTSNRSIMIKGSRKRTPLPDLPAIDAKIVNDIQSTIIKALSVKFSDLPKLGGCYLDEELKKLPLPSNMRSLNASLKPAIRGERVPIGNTDTKVIRAFVHWFDENGYQDIDLTALFFGMGKMQHIGWNGSKNDVIGCYSGDVRHRQGACAEYIDIDVKEALKKGFKYALMYACNYNGGTFESITDCVFGYMEREYPEADEIFVPKTLANTIKLTQQSSNCAVALIDLEAMEYIYLDIDMNGIPVASANVDTILDSIKPYMENPKFSVYDLMKLHVSARGTLELDKEKSDRIYNLEYFNTYNKILEYMGV